MPSHKREKSCCNNDDVDGDMMVHVAHSRVVMMITCS